MKIRLLLVACLVVITSAVCFAQSAVMRDTVQTSDNNFEAVKSPVFPSGRTILADMRTNSPAMYSQYRSAKKKQRTGIILTGAGGGVFVMGAIFSAIPDTEQGNASVSVFGIKIGDINIDGNNSGLRTAGTVMMVGGAACLAVGLPVMITGGKKKKQIFQDFKNQYYSSQQPLPYFQMNISPNRVGIAYVF